MSCESRVHLIFDGSTPNELCARQWSRSQTSTAQNVLFNLGRAVGGFGPLVVGALAARYSFGAAIALLASIYVVDIVATILLIPELKGVELS